MNEPTKSYVLGIDPGKNGGFCLMKGKEIILAQKMPDTCIGVWSLVNKCVASTVGLYKVVVYLEQVNAGLYNKGKQEGKREKRARMGATSAFTFGNGFGHLEMALTAANLHPFVRVRPQVWQTALNCLTKGDKNVSKARAQELYPDKKITHAIADAILIASYGVMQEKKSN